VAEGVVREVYTIRGWYRVNLDEVDLDLSRVAVDRSLPKQRIRWYFDGELALELQHYVGKSVRHYRKRGNANPLIWLNCSKPEAQAGLVE
jgi:hypothetical protein